MALRIHGCTAFPYGGNDVVAIRDLFLIQCVWDDVKIDRLFLPIDRDIIKTIPINITSSNDKMIRHYEKSSEYSVLNGYKVALKEKLLGWGTSTDHHLSSLWKILMEIEHSSKN